MTQYIFEDVPENVSLKLTSEQVAELKAPQRQFIFSGIVSEYEDKKNPYSGILVDQQGELAFFVPKHKVQRPKEFEDLLFFSLAHELPITFSGEYSLDNALYTLSSYQNPFLDSDSLLSFDKSLQVGFAAKGVDYFESDDGLRGLLYDDGGEVPFFMSKKKFNQENLTSIVFDFMSLQNDEGAILKVHGQVKPGAAFDISSLYVRLANDLFDYQPRL